jgi:hypothetical protein
MLKEFEDLQFQNNVENLFLTTSTTIKTQTYTGTLYQESLLDSIDIQLMLKIASVPYMVAQRTKQVSNPCYIGVAYTWYPN